VTLTFHIDESRDSGHHFHLGLLSTGEAVAAAEQELTQIVEQAMVDGACVWEAELHGVEVFHQTGQWAQSSIPQSIAVFDAALGVLAKYDIEVIARGADLPAFRKSYGDGDPFIWIFSNLLERLDERLDARSDYGLVIADQQNEYRERLQSDLTHAKRQGTGGYRSSKLPRIVDTAHFVDSKRSRMIQLADMCAFVARRRSTRRVEPVAQVEVLGPVV
jgi:hypothetical protein